MSLDEFLGRRYNFDKYNCGHFVAEVWQHLTGENIDELCKSFVQSDSETYFKLFKQRRKLRAPESPCVVFLQAPKLLPHAGIYVDNRVLHLTENGAKFDDLSILRVYYRLSYYK